MKSILFSLILVPLAAQAKDGNGRHHSAPECATLKSACEKAGFKKNGHAETAKGLSKDCMDKLVDGEKVAGVALDPKEASVAQCRTFLTVRSKVAPTTPPKKPSAH